ncbi:hypothetical protein [Microbispora corallina]|uniref:hypothetical protein n=1 Tax=Microbispora corallina TaxID=83302 RepID=UPI001951D93D|nr:hypothetical protein [Microbispora corallina]
MISEVKTPKSRRTLALTSELVDALKAHQAKHNAARLKAGDAWREHDIYGHLMEGDRRAATEAISGALLGQRKRAAPRVAPDDAEETG